MKIRTGFVSNSSSSSFIIGYNGNKQELKTYLKEQCKGNIFDNILDEMIEAIIENSKERTKEEMIDNYCMDNDEEFRESYPETYNCFKKGFTVFEGCFSSEDYGIEGALYNMNFNINNEKLYFKSIY